MVKTRVAMLKTDSQFYSSLSNKNLFFRFDKFYNSLTKPNYVQRTETALPKDLILTSKSSFPYLITATEKKICSMVGS